MREAPSGANISESASQRESTATDAQNGTKGAQLCTTLVASPGSATNVCWRSDPAADSWIRGWSDAVDDVKRHLSDITLGEIRTGLDRVPGRDADRGSLFAGWAGRARRSVRGAGALAVAVFRDERGQRRVVLSNEPINTTLVRLASVLDAAVEHGLLASNPA